jgi:hypothetical protein
MWVRGKDRLLSTSFHEVSLQLRSVSITDDQIDDARTLDTHLNVRLAVGVAIALLVRCNGAF